MSLDTQGGVDTGVLLNNSNSDSDFRLAEFTKTPIFLGDPLILTMNQLEQLRFPKRKHNFGGNLYQSVSSAAINYFNEMRRRLNGAQTTPDEPEWQKMRHPFVFKYPDDIPNEEMLQEIIRGWWGGITTMNAHTAGGVGDWEYNFFNPKLEKASITLKDGKIKLVGESIYRHEFEHAKKYYELKQKPGYICIGLEMYKRPGQPDGIRLHKAFQRGLDDHYSPEVYLAPLYPSQPDWELALSYDYRESVDILKKKPMWQILQASVQRTIEYHTADIKTLALYLQHTEEELFLGKQPYAIDRSKILSEYRPDK